MKVIPKAMSRAEEREEEAVSHVALSVRHCVGLTVLTSICSMTLSPWSL